MNSKRILFMTIVFALIGTIPKLLKNSITDWQILALHFTYIASCFLSFYTINTFLFAPKPNFSHLTRFVIGIICGFILLTFVHLLFLNIQPNRLVYFLNLKEINLHSIIMVTAFRTFIIQSIVYACTCFFINIDEKIAFQDEIAHLNNYLNDLRNNLPEKKEYKDTIITRFKDKVIPIGVSEIAFFHLSNGLVFQYLFSGQKYIQNESLESFEKDLDPTLFYRANRQFLIHKKTVERVEQIENRKLKVIPNPSAPEEIIISKAKASAFIKWLEK
ncbi:DNA-binding LytR/AlgR family response regulator [Chryseobacterium sp. SLBN-27]|uniref:LytR/AlgR family response regulator transcription factor n=1 Tax=Chryseobacterium sp. SLBN-27 TaxID=3042287 RepID=UPI00285EEBC9|nr:LytTR family DNA-binding domain-containing protein [Chryseobacterium sp. SLBN-27]MDR6160230.1 DNA-binding LytR/AlgR family response regulator [Chryseobacterium sp. SLBN-27]